MISSRWPQALVLLLVLSSIVAVPPAAAGENALTRAKDLYASAAYEEALAALDQLDASETASDVRSAAEYRVFCLLALDRRDQARQTIEAILRENPQYVPLSDVVSPRITNAIRDVRRQALPKIVTERYALAKSAFERKDPQALPRFEEVLRLLDDPDVNGAPSLNDLRTIVTGFRDLAQAMAAAPAVTAAPAAAPAAPPVAAPAAPPAAAPAPAPASASAAPKPEPRTSAAAPSFSVYSPDDADVRPPVARSKNLPDWRPIAADATKKFKGSVELLVDQEGNVLSAAIKESVHPSYDSRLLSAARQWKFTPASRQGVPVRYITIVQVVLQTEGR
jgi:TonB family protein